MLCYVVSTSTEVFFGTVCLIAVRHSDSGQTGCRRSGRVDLRPIVSVQRCWRCYSATADYYIAYCEAVRSAILATAWHLAFNCLSID